MADEFDVSKLETGVVLTPPEALWVGKLEVGIVLVPPPSLQASKVELGVWLKPTVGGVVGLAGVDESEAFPIRTLPARLTVKDMERNPFAAHLPDHPDDIADHSKEQQRVIREQHNKAQAGDTTFDYGLLLKSTPNQLYTLGSHGRFFHEDYGIIEARYCQYKSMILVDYQGHPVGRLKEKSLAVDWVVTNDISKSSPELVMGVTFTADVPVDGYYGWVVTHGVNPTAMGPSGLDVPVQNDEYSWAGTGTVGLNTTGPIVARRWGPNATTEDIPAGSAFINLEGPSTADKAAQIAEQTAPIQTAVDAVQSQADAQADLIAGNTGQIAVVAAAAAVLTQQLRAEEIIRARDVQNVRDSFDLTKLKLLITAGDAKVTKGYQDADNLIRTTAATALALAKSLADKIALSDEAGLSARIDDLVASLALAMSKSYVMSYGFSTAPGASEMMFQHTFTQTVTFQDDFLGFKAHCGTNPGSTYAFDMKLNGTSIGTVTVSTSGVTTINTTIGVSISGEFQVAAGDTFQLIAQSSTDTIANYSITWHGSK